MNLRSCRCGGSLSGSGLLGGFSGFSGLLGGCSGLVGGCRKLLGGCSGLFSGFSGLFGGFSGPVGYSSILWRNIASRTKMSASGRIVSSDILVSHTKSFLANRSHILVC